MGYKGRDVEVVALNAEQYLVVACDSCGAIGNKELDVVKVPPYVVGRLTAKVALLEVITIGATPQFITVAIANEPEPTGAGILQGVQDELSKHNLADMPIAVSTEKNMPTKQTAIGISVIGVCARQALRVGTSKPGDELYCLGLPKVGQEAVDPDDPEFAHGHQVLQLMQHKEIHDLIPVGSRGIRAEAESLATQIGTVFRCEAELELDLNKSAGPATCLIFSCTPGYLPMGVKPIYKIGTI